MHNNLDAWTERYGPWALITGASDGIGREMAREAAARGLNVVLVARRRPLLETLAGEIAAASTRRLRVRVLEPVMRGMTSHQQPVDTP